MFEKKETAADLSKESIGLPRQALSPDDQVRAAYFSAMGKAFGVPAEIADERALGLVLQKDELLDIDYKSKRGSGPAAAKMEELGKNMVAGGMPHLAAAGFAIGSHLTAMLQSDVQGPFFKNVSSWVGFWTESNERQRDFDRNVAASSVATQQPRPARLDFESEVRLGHMEAMLIALGQSEERAEKNAWQLYCKRSSFEGYDPKTSSPEDKVRAIALGTELAVGCAPHIQAFDLWLGSMAMALMTQPIRSGYMENLSGHIGYRMDSNAAQDVFLSELEKRAPLID